MEQKIIPDLHQGIDGDFQIAQNRMRMWYDEIEKKKGKGSHTYLLLTAKASPFILN